MELNRRNFLKGAGAAAVATAAAGSVALASEAADKPAAGTADTIITRETLEQGTWSFMVAPEPVPEDQIAETKTHDIVVVGSGMAGLTCAVAAAELGADVIVFSAGSKPISRGGSIHAIGSKYQKEHGIEDSPELRREQVMIDQIAGVHMMDMRKWARWENGSAESMDWMIDKMAAKGVKCSLAPAYTDKDGVLNSLAGEHNFFTDEAPMGVFTGAPMVAKAYADWFTDDFGGEIDYNTVAQYLIRDDDNTGRVSAVVAQTADGKYVKYVANKAVVLATGDFSKDFDMMAHFAPYGWEQFKDTLESVPEVDYDAEMCYTGLMPGTGQKMGLWIGAAWQKTFPNPCAINGCVWGPTHCVIDSFWGLNLAKDGKRFHNENTNFAFGAYSLMNLPEKTAYGIWDTNYAYTQDEWETLGCTVDNENGFVPSTPEQLIESWESSVASGSYVKADTLEELLDQLDIDKEAALASIEHYNECAKNGLDDEFHVNPELLFPIETPPFYASKSTGSTFLCVMGGLRCNEHLNVTDADDQPIEGLYEVGTMIGDFFSGCYNFAFPGQNLGACCTTLPYLLGKELAEL